jgi:urea transporter
VSTILEIALATLSILPFAFVAYLFVWAAKKDGEEDRAFQRRLGIRRRTR